MAVCYTFHVSGRVQGVGYRYFVVRQASKLGLSGFTRNLSDGSVEVVAEGGVERLERFHAILRQGPPAAGVEEVTVDRKEATGAYIGFDIAY